MKPINISTTITAIAISATILSAFALASTTTSAAESASANTSVTVAAGCSVTYTIDTAHTATISNGTYADNIGTTTFKTVCNDPDGYSIHAIGYSNDEFGNTKLLATVGGSLTPTNDITTGTATSGDTSAWAMKLSPVAGTFAPTILNDYNDYKEIPSTYTKVATLLSSTDATSGSSIQSTYRVFVDSTKPAGTYAGKVRYTMVHPASESAVSSPVNCPAGKICYSPNAEGVIDTMDDQPVIASSTSVELWASNFKRTGYGFAGWRTEGNTKYGPNQIIDTTSIDLSTNGLSLYAIWVESQGNLQNWNGCSGLSIGDAIGLTDTRDSNTYAVAKLRDGNCWMIENMRLGGTSPITLTPADSSGLTTNFTLSASINPEQTPWCEDPNATCIDQSMLNADNTLSPMDTFMPFYDVYSYGNYYNWYSATAGTRSYNDGTGNALGSICPAGWRLPAYAKANTDFYKLASVISGKTLDSDSQYWDDNDAEIVRTALQSYPNNFIASGFVKGFDFYNLGFSGGYWSASVDYHNSEGYALSFYHGRVYPGTNDYDKYMGLSVRCMAGSSFPPEAPWPDSGGGSAK